MSTVFGLSKYALSGAAAAVVAAFALTGVERTLTVVGASAILLLTVFFVMHVRRSALARHALARRAPLHERADVLADDVTGMNARAVKRIIYPLCNDDVRDALDFARTRRLRVSCRGQGHTMGGHTIATDGVVLDMRFMDKVLHLDVPGRSVTVQPGATWASLIRELDPHGLSPATMQSYSTFSVGGTLSANAHGITNDFSMQECVRSMEIMTADGAIVSCSRTENSDLFTAILGGYGLFGVILSATLRVEANVRLETSVVTTNAAGFVALYERLLADASVNVKLARINITDVDDITLYVFKSMPGSEGCRSHIAERPREMSPTARLMYKWLLADSDMQRLRFFLERRMGQALDWSSADASRNALMYESAAPLARMYNPLITRDITHVLQEYFIPHAAFGEWMAWLAVQVPDDSLTAVSLMNITIRYLRADSTSLLPYARTNAFAFVLYFRLERNARGDAELLAVHRRFVAKALALGGTFYLPYRHHYSAAEMLAAYPSAPAFFARKAALDPTGLFSNAWYERYAPEFHTPARSTLQLPSSEDDASIAGAGALPTAVSLQRHASLTSSLSTRSLVTYESITSVAPRPLRAFKALYDAAGGAGRVSSFVRNVFDVEPPEELLPMLKAIMDAHGEEGDAAVYAALTAALGGRPGMLWKRARAAWRQLTLLSKTRAEIASEAVQALRSTTWAGTLSSYVSIGDAGRYVRTLAEQLRMSGPFYVVHDSSSVMDVVERASLLPVGTFVQYDYTSVAAIPASTIAPESIDLVTMFQGLHHIAPGKLPQFLRNVRALLRVGGALVIREHDARGLVMPMAHVAHSVFNAVTGVTAEEEAAEVRAFRTVLQWRSIVEAFGFADARVYAMQDDDSTEDVMMVFIKTADEVPARMDGEPIAAPAAPAPEVTDATDAALFRMRADVAATPGLALDDRDQHQTYQTLTEWLLVDVAQQFGRFMEHTPWFSFPFVSTTILFWTLYLREVRIIHTRFGASAAYCNSYTLMNLFIGCVLTLLFAQMAVLAILPWLVFGVAAPAQLTIQVAVQCEASPEDAPDLMSMPNVTRVLAPWRPVAPSSRISIAMVEVIRYRKFEEFVFACGSRPALVDAHVSLLRIAGQTAIQAAFVCRPPSQMSQAAPTVGAAPFADVPTLLRRLGAEVLLDYSVPGEGGRGEVAAIIPVTALVALMAEARREGVQLVHLYDF